MKNIDLFNAISGVDEALIDRSLNDTTAHNDKTVHIRRFRPAIAVCIAVVIIVGVIAFAFAAEAKEYNDAMAFFEENGLSSDGLTRSEIKAVYRDIITETYAYDKTAEVMKKSVPGWEIDTDVMTSDDATSPKGKITFESDFTIRKNDENPHDDFEKGILRCYRDGELIWTAEFEKCSVEGYRYCGDDTIAWGHRIHYIPQENGTSWKSKIVGWAGCVDSEGNVLWHRELDHDFRHEEARAALRNADGTWAVFTYGIEGTADSHSYIGITQIDKKGTEQSFCRRETEHQDMRQWNAVRIGDDYLLQLGDSSENETANIVRIDREGNIRDNFSFSGEDCDYFITDMTEFGGKVYLSAYAYPKQSFEGEYEIAGMLRYVVAMDKEGKEVTREGLTPIAQETYTAVLLICDETGKEPQTFYSVKGALGYKMTVVGDTHLEWTVHSVNYADYMKLNAYRFTLGCNDMRYTFDADGNLLSQTEVGEAWLHK